ncbi:MAG: polysaccharide biosynthesis tyrosine autokinase [Limnobacter sp.]|nr:polysaccharide biosynthesis tyrosine autokinase [Limnobacter sp.]
MDTSGVVTSAAAQLSGTTAQLIDAKAQRARLQSAYQRVRQILAAGGDLKDEPAVARTPAVIASKASLTEAQRALEQISERYGPQHPSYRQADAQYKAALTSYDREVNLAAAQIQRDYETADATVNAIDQTVSNAKQQVASVNRSEFELSSLQREVQTNRQLYELFLNRIKETSATDGLQKTIGRVIEPAQAQSVVRSFPKPFQYTVVAFVLTLLLGSGLAVLTVVLDDTVKTTEEVEQRLHAAVMGTVPVLQDGTKGMAVLQSDPQGLFAEAFRTIRTSLALSELDSDKVVLAITSSVASEGKSTVAMNLASMQSQTKKTVLIDADMRKPTLGRDLLGDTSAEARPGLSDVISGVVTLDEALVELPDSPLVLLPAGKLVPNPLDLLSSKRFGLMLDALKARFDVVILDTPPVRLVSDALVVAECCTSMLYVVQSDKTSYKLARRGLQDVRSTHARLLGVVLNKQDVEKADKYYGEYSGLGTNNYTTYGVAVPELRKA